MSLDVPFPLESTFDFGFEELPEPELIPDFPSVDDDNQYVAAAVAPLPQSFSATPQTLFSSPKQDYGSPLSCGSDFLSPEMNWEADLENLVQEQVDLVPVLEEHIKDRLIHMGVPQFNKQVKELRLSERTVQLLKAERKRLKNRMSATRSRNRKETQVYELEKRVSSLLDENASQKEMIQQLRRRIEQMEKTKSV